MSEGQRAATMAAGQLRAIVERVERLAEERAGVSELIKEVYAEAKSNGFDVKTLRKVVALRKQKPEERAEADAMLEIYTDALGMGGTPLDDWAAQFAATKLEGAARRVMGAFAEVEGVTVTLGSRQAGARR